MKKITACILSALIGLLVFFVLNTLSGYDRENAELKMKNTILQNELENCRAVLPIYRSSFEVWEGNPEPTGWVEKDADHD